MSRRFDSTPWARAELGPEAIEVIRTRIPLDCSLHLAAQRPGGPFHVVLTRNRVVLFDEWHADLEGTIGRALATLPSELESRLAASLAARGIG